MEHILSVEESHRVSRALLEPYTLPADSPYLSEDQLELCQLDFQGRIQWMGEWLAMALAADIDNDDEDPW